MASGGPRFVYPPRWWLGVVVGAQLVLAVVLVVVFHVFVGAVLGSVIVAVILSTWRWRGAGCASRDDEADLS